MKEANNQQTNLTSGMYEGAPLFPQSGHTSRAPSDALVLTQPGAVMVHISSSSSAFPAMLDFQSSE